MAFPQIPERLRAYFDRHTPGFWSWWQAAKPKLDQMDSIVVSGVTDSNITFTDNTNNNVSISKHGFMPKLPNDASKFFNGVGSWVTGTGGGGASALADLTDVNLTSLADGDMLQYDATSGKWINGGVISLDGPF